MEDQTKKHTWTCPHCCKTFSPNYKYKSHLKRCLCFKPITDHHHQAIIEIKTELKDEFSNMFRDAIDGLREELKSSVNQQPLVNHQQVNQVNHQQVVKKNTE